MAQLRLKVLSDGEIEKVHKLSCEILSQTGMIIESEEIERRLLKLGAKPGKTSHTVCFDEKMIEDALGTCPSSFSISSINGDKYLIGKDGRQYSSCMIDPKMSTGNRESRKPVLKDCADNAKIIDALEGISMPYKMDLDYEDVRPSLSVVKSNEVLFQNFTRHVICAPMNEKDARTWMEMSEIMAPGELAKTPIVSVLISPSSPLSLHEDCLQMLQCVLEYGVPIICLPCPMCGLTSPLSVIGTLIVLNAENLALITVTQMLKPGNPMIYHTVAMPADTRTLDARLSAPEKMLMSLAASQMGQFYGLPSAVTGSSTDVNYFDVQNGFETMSHIFPAVLSDANLITGIGSNTNACGTSSEQILIDYELLTLAEHFRRGIDMREIEDAYQSIIRVKPGGNYIFDEYTIKQFGSSEFFIPDLIDWSGHENSGKGMLMKATERAKNLLNNHHPNVSQDKLSLLHKYVEKY